MPPLRSTLSGTVNFVFVTTVCTRRGEVSLSTPSPDKKKINVLISHWKSIIQYVNGVNQVRKRGACCLFLCSEPAYPFSNVDPASLVTFLLSHCKILSL